MNQEERLNLKKLIKEMNCEDNTDNIRKLKHSTRIRDDITNIQNKKHEHKDLKKSNYDDFLEICRNAAPFLYMNYTDIFHKVCKDRNCISFNGPVISEIDGKTYKFGEKCYQYKLKPDKCDPMKKTVEVSDPVFNS